MGESEILKREGQMVLFLPGESHQLFLFLEASGQLDTWTRQWTSGHGSGHVDTWTSRWTRGHGSGLVDTAVDTWTLQWTRGHSSGVDTYGSGHVDTP